LRADYDSGIETVAVSPQAPDAAGFDRTARAFSPDAFAAS
jgi:hypothetical protein